MSSRDFVCSLIASALVQVILGGLLAATCSAAPNGLNQIPIAKVYGDGGAAFSFADVDAPNQQTYVTSQFGVFNIAEFGLDYQATPSNQRGILLNGKLLLFHKPGSLPDIAAGIQDVANKVQAVPYIVATTQPKLFGFSIGAIRPTAQEYQLMGGVTYNLNANFQIVSDSIDGRLNYTTLGFIDNLTPVFQLNVTYANPNYVEAGPRGYILNLAYIFHLPHGGITHGQDLSTNGGAVPTGNANNLKGAKTPATGSASK